VAIVVRVSIVIESEETTGSLELLLQEKRRHSNDDNKGTIILAIEKKSYTIVKI
jgi:hypothetical protein